MDDYDITQLDVTDYDVAVPNEYWCIGSDTLLVMLPGLGYTNQMPLMFYIQELAMARHWDIVQVNYDYRGMMGTTQEERVYRITADCQIVMDAALAKGGYKRIVLAGKSLGTLAMTALLKGGISRDAISLWLTPLINWPEVREVMTTSAPNAAVVIGTRDDHYDPLFVEELRNMGAQVAIVDGGDHSLDIEGDVDESIGVLRQVIGALDRFLIR